MTHENEKKLRLHMRLAALLLATVMAFTMIGCVRIDDPGNIVDPGTDPGENTPDAEAKNGMMITLKDEKNIEKVITKAPFKTPSFGQNQGVFKISAVISDTMVLQANTCARLFGEYCPLGGEAPDKRQIGLELLNDKTGNKEYFYATPDTDGSFDIWMSPHDYGGPYTITLFDKEGHSVAFKDVLFGEVWILAGQSNMGWALGQCYKDTINSNLYEDLIQATHNNEVRWMGPWPVSSEEPAEYLSSVRPWTPAEPEYVYNWSAIGFFFAIRLNELYNVPVGVISTAVGGIAIDQWRAAGIWYRGMVNPVKKFSSRGVVWYQGEGDFNKYGKRLEELIEEWRVEFENPDLFWCASEIARDQREEAYYKCREEVKSLYGKVDKYTYAVTIDTGMFPEWCAEGDIYNINGEHPYDKLKVGERLADMAAKDCYGAEGLWSCPYIKTAELNEEENKVILTFDNIGEGLVLEGSFGFEVRHPKTRRYLNATPELISSDTVVLTWEDDFVPSHVRYGYKNNRGDDITTAKASVCLYNTKDGEAAYPAEQFTVEIGFGK